MHNVEDSLQVYERKHLKVSLELHNGIHNTILMATVQTSGNLQKDFMFSSSYSLLFCRLLEMTGSQLVNCASAAVGRFWSGIWRITWKS